MSPESLDWYLALADSEKLTYLAIVSNHLTIHGRAFAPDLSDAEQIHAYQGLNELQHQISGQIVSLGLQRDRYPHDVFLQILQEKAEFYGLDAHLKKSLAYTRSLSLRVRPQ